MEWILRYDDVTIAYGPKTVVHDVSFAVHAGEVVAIVGESGSGKSTLLKGAMDLLVPQGKVTAGDISWRSQSLLTMAAEKRRQLYGNNLALIWQDAGASLCPIRTIGDQCVEMAQAHGLMDTETIKERAFALFTALGLRDSARLWDSYAFALSGGMNQRVGIAMAMLLQPAVILADEPTSALDVYTQQQVLQALEALRANAGTAMVIVTHDMAVVKAVAQYVIVLQGGRVVEQGETGQVLTQPQAAYTKALLAATPILGGR